MAFRGMTTGLPEKGNSLKLPEANRELQLMTGYTQFFFSGQ